MSDPAILARVENLERQNRLFKLVGLLLLVVLVGIGAVQKPNLTLPLTVQKLVLVDEQGNTRGVLTTDKDGAFLAFQDGTGSFVRLGLVSKIPHLDTPDKQEGVKNWLAPGRVVPAK